MPAIRVEHVSKQYSQSGLLEFLSGKGRNRDALQDVTLQIAAGEIVGLLGPNGAGKTTLLKVIAGSLYPDSGFAAVEGRMGLVTSDERSFYWRLTGRQNLEFFAALYKLPSATVYTRVGELLELLSLTWAADQRFDTYSSGMKQRMAIARGLLSDPAVVLYDEPTRALDPASARDIRQWIRDTRNLRTRTTHLIATNQLDEAESLCDRVLILSRGRIIASGSIGEIKARFRQCSVHRIVCHGVLHSRSLTPAEECGLLKLSAEPEGYSVTIRLDSEKNSRALSLVLQRILELGGTIESCQTEELPFDEIFCSLVLDQQPLAVGAHA